MPIRIGSLLLALTLAATGCTAREGISGTLSSLSTIAGARRVLASFPAFKALDEAPACVVAEVVRQGSDAGLAALNEAVRPRGGVIDITSCGALDPADIEAASAFLISGPLDTTLGIMVTAGYHETDAVGFGVACAVIEGVRASGLDAFRVALAGGGKIAWTAPDEDGAACLARINARAASMLAPAPL